MIPRPGTRNDKNPETPSSPNSAKILGEVGHVWQDQSGHSEIRKGQGRKEPGGLIPDLCFLGEPGLQHAEVQEGAEGLARSIFMVDKVKKIRNNRSPSGQVESGNAFDILSACVPECVKTEDQTMAMKEGEENQEDEQDHEDHEDHPLLHHLHHRHRYHRQRHRHRHRHRHDDDDDDDDDDDGW